MQGDNSPVDARQQKGGIVRLQYTKAIFVVLVLAALAAQLGNIVWGT
jgi:hypothetical protein